MIKSASDVLIVRTSRPRTVNSLPGTPGLLGLMVATSNVVGASAAIARGGAGIANAVSFAARTRVNGVLPGPCAKVPTMELPSGLNLPSNVIPAAATAILTAPPWTVVVAVIPTGLWSML